MTDSETDTSKTEAELRIARVQALSNADLMGVVTYLLADVAAAATIGPWLVLVLLGSPRWRADRCHIDRGEAGFSWSGGVAGTHDRFRN